MKTINAQVSDQHYAAVETLKQLTEQNQRDLIMEAIEHLSMMHGLIKDRTEIYGFQMTRNQRDERYRRIMEQASVDCGHLEHLDRIADQAWREKCETDDFEGVYDRLLGDHDPFLIAYSTKSAGIKVSYVVECLFKALVRGSVSLDDFFFGLRTACELDEIDYDEELLPREDTCIYLQREMLHFLKIANQSENERTRLNRIGKTMINFVGYQWDGLDDFLATPFEPV